MWDDPQVEHQLYLYLALGDHIANRKLRKGVPLLLERASYGDMGETMRGLHHSLSHAYDPDWVALADVCIQAAKYPQPGARLWSIDLLGRLNSRKLSDVRGLSSLLQALYDPAKLVRFHACYALEWLCESHPEFKQEVRNGLQRLIVETSETLKHAQDALKTM